MITREEILNIKRKKEREQAKSTKIEVEKLIERCSKELRRGRLVVYPVTTNTDVLKAVGAKFSKEGIDMKVTDCTVHAKAPKKDRRYEYMLCKLTFSVKEDE